jgi:hypothetical protein
MPPTALPSPMAAAPSEVRVESRAARINPFFSIVCGMLLMLGGALVYWLEPGPATGKAQVEQVVSSGSTATRALQRARDREAEARAEQERRAAEETAARTRRATLELDGAAVAEARRQREELARRQAEAAESQRAAAATEDAWNRFYRPSATCRDPSNAATVECVNEFVRAKREFQARGVAKPD